MLIQNVLFPVTETKVNSIEHTTPHTQSADETGKAAWKKCLSNWSCTLSPKQHQMLTAKNTQLVLWEHISDNLDCKGN